MVGGINMTATLIGNHKKNIATEYILEGDGWLLFYRIIAGETDETTIATSGCTISNREHYLRQLAILRLAGIELWPTQ
jgi:hypothetical protein